MLYPNILFLVLDSLRPDKIYGKKNAKIPNLENLLKKGTYFSQAISAADATLLSWASIYTGKFPFKTGIRSARYNKLDENTKTIFDVLKNYNYSFYGFLPTFSETIGLFPKFSNNNNLYDFTERLYTGLDKKILNLINSSSMIEPWFLNIHLMDLHFPLVVPPKFDSAKFGSSKYERILSHIDTWLGEILKILDLKNLILIVTADHGTSIKKISVDGTVLDFEDKGKNEMMKKKFTKNAPKFLKPMKDKIFFSLEAKNQSRKLKSLEKYNLKPHEKRALLSGQFSIDHDLFDEKMRVPLLFVGKNIENNNVYSKQVRTVDIVPTIYKLLEISGDSKLDGKSLLPFNDDKNSEDLVAYMESNPMIDKKSNDVIGIRTSHFKYFRDKDSSLRQVHLYDLINDPYEDKNIAPSNPELVNEMENKLKKIISNKKISVTENELDSDEIERELKKLGYI